MIVVQDRREAILELHDRQAGDALEVAQIARCHTVAEFQGCDPDQHIGKREAHAFGLVLAVDLADAKGNRHSDRINGQGREQFLNKLLTFLFSLRCVDASRAVRQFEESNNLQGDFRLSGCAGDSREHLSCILPLALGFDQDAGIEDQSHAGGSSGSRWLSIAASTSLAKSASMTAVESSGKSAMH